MSYFAQLLSQQAYTLIVPKEYSQDIQRHVRHRQVSANINIERSPFRRQLDFWAFSVAVALSNDIEPLQTPSSSWGVKFIDTRWAELSADLCNLLAVATFHHISKRDTEGAFDDPKQIIDMGNRLAGAGCKLVIESLSSSDFRVTPLEKVLNCAAQSLYR